MESGTIFNNFISFKLLLLSLFVTAVLDMKVVVTVVVIGFGSFVVAVIIGNCGIVVVVAAVVTVKYLCKSGTTTSRLN